MHGWHKPSQVESFSGITPTDNIVTTHPFSCVRQQAARESGVMEKGARQRVGITRARSPQFNCPQATITTEPHGRWLTTIFYSHRKKACASQAFFWYDTDNDFKTCFVCDTVQMMIPSMPAQHNSYNPCPDWLSNPVLLKLSCSNLDNWTNPSDAMCSYKAKLTCGLAKVLWTNISKAIRSLGRIGNGSVLCV